MDAACTIQDSIHVFSLVHKYVSRILGTYQEGIICFRGFILANISIMRQIFYTALFRNNFLRSR